MKFKKLEFKDGSVYSIALDDKCLVICAGKSGKSKNKVWLCKEMIDWIAENKDHLYQIDFSPNTESIIK